MIIRMSIITYFIVTHLSRNRCVYVCMYQSIYLCIYHLPIHLSPIYLSFSASATTEYHKFNGLSNRNVFSHRSRGWQVQVQGTARFDTGEGNFWVAETTFLLGCHMVERRRVFIIPLLLRTVILSWEPHPHDLI